MFNVDLGELATKTSDYTGAEIEAICNEAALKGLEEIMEVAKTDEEVFFKYFQTKSSISFGLFVALISIIQKNQSLILIYF